MIFALHLWESTICVAIAAAVAALARRGPARTRHAIWLLASLKFLVPFSLVAAAGHALARLAPHLAAPLAGAAGWLESSLPAWGMRTSLASAAGGAGNAAWLGPALTVTWVVGAASLAVWRWWTWRALVRQTRRDAAPATAGRELDALDRVCRRWNVRRRPPLSICRTALEPGVLGIRRPRIVWPAGLAATLDDGQLEAVLAHEVSHVRRRDNAAMLVHTVVETAFWFHPLVWWIGNRLVAERERACDEEVTMVEANRQGYADGLLKVCRFCLRAPAACAARAGGADLVRRIERILEPPPAPLSRLARALLINVALVVAGTPLASGVLSASQDPTAGAGATPAASSPAASSRDQQPDAERPSKDVRSPRLIHETKPVYPESAKEARIQGSVLLEAVVNVKGLPEDIKVTRSLHPDLDAAATRALEQWRFAPGTKDGRPVRVRVDIEMSFTLK